MKRVDRLLLQVQNAQRLDALQLSVAFIDKNEQSGKWEAIADLWDGKPQGETRRLTMVCDTEEEAIAAVDEVNELHQPTGKRASEGYRPVVIMGYNHVTE